MGKTVPNITCTIVVTGYRYFALANYITGLLRRRACSASRLRPLGFSQAAVQYVRPDGGHMWGHYKTPRSQTTGHHRRSE
jgi:hypothetical protein